VAANFDITVDNMAAVVLGNAILAVTGSYVNYEFVVQFSNADMKTGGDTLGLTAVPVVMTTDVKQGLAAGSSVVFSGTVDLTLYSTSCLAANYLCVSISSGTGASYVDADVTATSNVVCTDISTIKTCVPGKYDQTLDFWCDINKNHRPSEAVCIPLSSDGAGTALCNTSIFKRNVSNMA